MTGLMMWPRFLRLHTLASVGYVVIIIDSRGSGNRGVNFEAHIHSQMVGLATLDTRFPPECEFISW